MVASKAFVTFALAAVALAAPSRRQIEEPPPEDRATCTYVMTPNPPVVDDSTLDNDAEFTFTIGVRLANDSPTQIAWVFDNPLPWVHNEDGSYEVNATTAFNGLSADEVKAIVTAWPGQILPGRFVPEWAVGSVVCPDSPAEIKINSNAKGVMFGL
ncbi:hypothetical protein AAF712_011301 [Marasmius tenuissimus]|uniref:Uncharacterized protein n=1 Tax=Marasmius tenuissimus TaxID=585030 RepID=A0ABR2ZLL5_9AGAR